MCPKIRSRSKILAACVAPDGTPPLLELATLAETEGLSGFVSSAKAHGVTGLLFKTVRQSDLLYEQLGPWLRHEQMQLAAHHLRVLADLRFLAQKMDAAGIPWICFKGPVLAKLVYESSDVRDYSDLDIAVRPSDFLKAVRSLELDGCYVLDRNPKVVLEERRGQLHVRLPLGTVADVHWHLINRQQVRSGFVIDMDTVFERRRSLKLAGLAVDTLDHVDTLVHLCTHAGLAGGHFLRQLVDIALVLKVEAPPWDAVVDRANNWRVGPLVEAVLGRVSRLLGIEVPAVVRRELEPLKWRRPVVQILDRLWPPENAPLRESPSTLWVSSLRPGATESFRAFRYRLLRRPWRTEGTWWIEEMPGAVESDLVALMHRIATDDQSEL